MREYPQDPMCELQVIEFGVEKRGAYLRALVCIIQVKPYHVSHSIVHITVAHIQTWRLQSAKPVLVKQEFRQIVAYDGWSPSFRERDFCTCPMPSNAGAREGVLMTTGRRALWDVLKSVQVP